MTIARQAPVRRRSGRSMYVWVVKEAVDEEEAHAGHEHGLPAAGIDAEADEWAHEQRSQTGDTDEEADLALGAAKLLDEEGERGEEEKVGAEEDKEQERDAHNGAGEHAFLFLGAGDCHGRPPPGSRPHRGQHRGGCQPIGKLRRLLPLRYPWRLPP
jgi:hypothetical protein